MYVSCSSADVQREKIGKSISVYFPRARALTPLVVRTRYMPTVAEMLSLPITGSAADSGPSLHAAVVFIIGSRHAQLMCRSASCSC